jgi:putative endonuclease
MMGWYVYILRCRDGTLYTGIAVDLRRRLEAHRRGVAAKYTRSRRPVTLAYQEQQPDRSSALKREAGLRRLGPAGKLALIGGRRSPWRAFARSVGPRTRSREIHKGITDRCRR